MHPRLALSILAALALPVPAAERLAVTGVKPLLTAAMDQGEAHGVLIGPAAQYVAKTFGSTAPIEIDVKTVRDLGEPGCKRLAVTTAQDGVTDFNRNHREAKPGRKAFTYQINYCRNGGMPQAAEAAR